jgi:hypothetical protein
MSEKDARDQAKEKVRQLEEDPPEKLEDWPDGKAKYETYGGPDSESAYDEGPTEKLGPSDLEYQEDGSIEIKGEKVDNPEDYKADEPVPGAPDHAKERASGGEDSDDGGDGEERDESSSEDDD